MLRRLKDAVKATPLAIPFIWTKGLIRQPASQNVGDDLLLPGGGCSIRPERTRRATRTSGARSNTFRS